MVTYRAGTDAQDYEGYYDMTLAVNGIYFKYDDFKHISGDWEGNTMFGTGKDRTAQVIINRRLLELVGITEVNALTFDITLGYNAHGSVYEEVEFLAEVYPGAKVDTASWFPEARGPEWVLADDEDGKAQITGATYWRSAADNAIMGISLYVVTQGKTDTNFLIDVDGLTAGEWTARETLDDSGCHMSPEKRYFKITMKGAEHAPADYDFSQTTMELSFWKNDQNAGEDTRVIDLSGLGDSIIW